MTLDAITRDEYLGLIMLARIFTLARRGEIPDKMRGGWPIRLVSSKRRSGHIIVRSVLTIIIFSFKCLNDVAASI